MDNFPTHFKPDFNKNQSKLNHITSYYRKHIYETMLSDKFKIPDNCGINLHNVAFGSISEGEYTIYKEPIEQIMKELNELGWETQLAYGNSVLFVFDKNNVPNELVSCSSFE